MPYLLHQLLTESASKYPEQEALAFKSSSMTYADLDQESNRLAQGLTSIGVARGDRVGIYLERGIDAIVGLFGILKAGASYVPIDPFCPPARLSFILNKCKTSCLLTSQEKLAVLEHVFPSIDSVERIVVMNGLGAGPLFSEKIIDGRELRRTASSSMPQVHTVDTDIAYILFTSGSTGNPKGVMLTHLNALTFVNAAHDFFRITMHDRLSNICPLHFDMSVFDLFVAFKAGATVVIIPEAATTFPAILTEVIEKNRISVWNSVPSALSLLATYKNLGSHDLSHVRLIVFAGELFPLKYLRRLQEAVPGARFCNMYGQTEANSSTYYWVEPLAKDAKAPLPIGKALPNFDVFAMDEDGRQVTAAGQEGELYVRASTVALGYWDDAEKTEKAFVKNPLQPGLQERVYRTGDLVHLDPDGNYVFLGRKDHMIKSRGYRIEIGEIETVLCNHPEIKNAVVIPIPDELIGNRISAIVVPVTKGTIRKEDVLQYCSQHLPKYMLPETMEFRDSLPATSSGKVDRKKLLDRDGRTVQSLP